MSKQTYGHFFSIWCINVFIKVSGLVLSYYFYIRRSKYAIIHGTKYAIDFIVLCYFDDDMTPIFGKIKDIIYLPNSSQTLFVLDPMIPSRFNKHFYAYQVMPLQDQTLIYTKDELADYHPMYTSKSFHVSSPSFVRLKYHIE